VAGGSVRAPVPGSEDRSPARLEAIVRAIDPYVYSSDPDGFVRVCLAALGVFVPPRAIGPLLEESGFSAGWEPLSDVEAQHAANQGYPVVAVGGGHLALVVPSRFGGEIWIAQGGAAPRVRAPCVAAFGGRPPSYWGHP
jgi:hypothetical protein